MKQWPLLPILPFLFLSGCATQQQPEKHAKASGVTLRVRTTAYTHTERGGCNNAIGCRLSCGKVSSASADWSRYPLGTKFQILNTGEVFKIDDYGGALVGTNTIDLYKTTRLKMRKWGVRYVDIRILEWGSAQKSLKVLKPRARIRRVRVMIDSLNTSS